MHGRGLVPQHFLSRLSCSALWRACPYSLGPAGGGMKSGDTIGSTWTPVCSCFSLDRRSDPQEEKEMGTTVQWADVGMPVIRGAWLPTPPDPERGKHPRMEPATCCQSLLASMPPETLHQSLPWPGLQAARQHRRSKQIHQLPSCEQLSIPAGKAPFETAGFFLQRRP